MLLGLLDIYTGLVSRYYPERLFSLIEVFPIKEVMRSHLLQVLHAMHIIVRKYHFGSAV